MQLYSADVETLDTALKIDTARAGGGGGAGSRSADRELGRGVVRQSHTGRHIFANSRGFAGEYRSSYCSLSAIPVAKDGESMERDYWYTMARGYAGLEAAEEVGRTAARRALRRLNPVKVETQKVPIVFEPGAARSLLDNIFEAVHGMSIYRQESFLAGKLGRESGERGSDRGGRRDPPRTVRHVAVRRRRAWPSRRTVVIERGVLKSYLHEYVRGAEARHEDDGERVAGLDGQRRDRARELLCCERESKRRSRSLPGVRNGFYVTEMMGFGVNIVTGDYSRGAAGLWIRDGELAFAVSEVTIAGNLREMLLGIEAIGSDLKFRGSLAAPTLKIGEMTVGGKTVGKS